MTGIAWDEYRHKDRAYRNERERAQEACVLLDKAEGLLIKVSKLVVADIHHGREIDALVGKINSFLEQKWENWE